MDNTILKLGQQSLLGYIPALVIKNIIDKKIDIQTNVFPQYYVFHTVSLFADISGFTKLSEAFSKKGRIGPEFLAYSLNRYMEQLVGIIGKNGGDIFKFAGDALLVIWPESTGDLSKPCRRATQCALDIQAKLHDVEIGPNKRLSIKVGLGVGEVRILVVGGQFRRCEYLSVGDALAQACDAESKATGGGQTICSGEVFDLIGDYIEVEEIVEKNSRGRKIVEFYLIKRLKGERIPIKADAYLLRSKFSSDKIRANMPYLKSFVPAAISLYLDVEKETWAKEIKLLTIMFMILGVDLKQTKSQEGLEKIQKIIKTVQRGLYRTRGSLNKFLMDDKGSVILACWGLPPISSIDDHAKGVYGVLTLMKELKRLGCGAKIGLTTGTCFSGVCGNIGNRREYSLLGEVVNLSARHMQQALYYANEKKLDYCLLLDETTKELIQNKIPCDYMTSGELKGFKNIFHFFTPVKEIPISTQTNPLPSIRTHKNNAMSTVPCHFTEKDKNAENELKNALRMVGRENELDWLKSVIQKVYKQGLNELVLVKGVLGSGKSLFIRKAIYEFFIQEKEVSKFFFGVNNNPIVFVSFQKPDSYNVVFNGWENIFKLMYLRLSEEINKQSKPRKMIKMKVGDHTIKFMVDEIGEVLLQSDCYMNIKYLDEIFHPENSSNSYNEELKNCYENEQNNLETKAKISKNTTQFFVTIKTDISNSIFAKHFYLVNPEQEKLLPKPFEPNPRDIFFETRKFESKTEKAIINFFISLLKKYQEMCVHKYNSELPLIFVIEDCHLIDNISCEFIKEIATELDLTHTLIICSYQLQMSMVVSNPLEKFNSKHDLMTIPNCIEMNPFFYYDEIFPLIRDFLKQKYNLEIEKIEKKLLYIIISKSFKGIPLFILELIDRFLKDNTYARVKGKELVSTSALLELDKTNDWAEFPVPFLFEAVISSIIDSLNPKEIIILKIASVIGVLFDLNKLNEFNPFNNVTFDELHSLILSFERRGMLEILWDSDPRYTVCKFSIPFLRDILYQRMLIEQRNEIHLNVARSLQNNKFSYTNPENELRMLRMHLRQNEKTIGTYMEEDEELIQLDKKISSSQAQGLSLSNNKMYLVKAICDKINNHDFYDHSHILKCGELYKKMDSSKLWDCKFCMITIDKFIYYNCENDHIQSKDPQGKFWLKDISDVAVLANHEFGKKKNLFAISVSKWFNNDSEGSAKTFLFSSDSKEDLMVWITTLNFLCLNAFYGRFTKMFGIINLPLVKKDTMERKYKKKFSLIDNQYTSNQMKKVALFCGSFTRKSIYNKSLRAIGMTAERLKGKDRLLSTFKGNLIMNFEVNEEQELNEKINRLREDMANLTQIGLMLIYGFIQQKIFEICDEDDDEKKTKEIKIPSHLDDIIYDQIKNSTSKLKKRKKTARDSEKFNPSDFGKKLSVEEVKEELIDGLEEDHESIREDDSYPIVNVSYDSSNENGNELPQTNVNDNFNENNSSDADNGLDNHVIKEVNGKPITIRKKQIKQGHTILVDYQTDINEEYIQTTYGSRVDKDNLISAQSSDSFKAKKGILNKEGSKKERPSIRDDLSLTVGENRKMLDRIHKRDTIYKKGYTTDVFSILENEGD